MGDQGPCDKRDSALATVLSVKKLLRTGAGGIMARDFEWMQVKSFPYFKNSLIYFGHAVQLVQSQLPRPGLNLGPAPPRKSLVFMFSNGWGKQKEDTTCDTQKLREIQIPVSITTVLLAHSYTHSCADRPWPLGPQ